LRNPATYDYARPHEATTMPATATALKPIAQDPDALLMIRVRDGDPAAFESLVCRHRPGLIQFLFHIVHERAVAEELSQETFLRLYLTRERYEASAKFTTWLCVIARNLALNWLRDHTRERGVEYIDAHRHGRGALQLRDRRPDLAEGLHRISRNEGIRRAVRNLPERQRTVVIMSKFAGQDCIEIARELRCTHQAVRSLLFRAYAALRETLNPEVL
jgi:RNA polymerase sigma-70 factor, ECF subfamily